MLIFENNGARMSTNFILNEPLMIRDRLQEAYKKIIFIADNDFAQDSNYKKANQALYARIKKLEENPELEKPRLVKDVIPNSNLAKYGLYQYNEARERLYTPSLGDISLQYIGFDKSDVGNEPWMLPEVEQIFTHTILTGTFNFHLYEAELERLQLELDDSTSGLLLSSSTSYTNDLSKSIPLLDHLFERAPGKRYGINQNELEIVDNLPYYFNVQDYDDVLLRKRILSDVVRDLWNKPKLENIDKLIKVHKSSLENLFIEEESFKNVNSLKTGDTPKSLQKLVSSIVNLNEGIPKMSLVPIPTANKEPTEKEVSAPVRRLYSDVVQGNKSPTKSQQTTESCPSPQTTAFTSEILHPIKIVSVPTTDNSPINSPCRGPMAGSMAAGGMAAAAAAATGLVDGGEEKLLFEESLGAKTTNSPEGLASKNQPQPASKFPFSENGNNASQAFLNNQNLFLNDFQLYDSNFIRNSSTNNFQNFYNPIQFMPGIYNTTNYRVGYTNTNFPTTGGTFATNQQLTSNRQNLTTGTCPQHQWFFPSYRPSNLCSYGNFLGQLLIPQMPTKHRWSNPHFGRPPTPQNIYQPVNQNWGMQNVYRSNSTQQMSGYQLYDSQKAAKLKKSTTSPTPTPSGKFARSKTPDPTMTPKKKILTKPSSDYKLMTRQGNDIRMPTTSSVRTFDVDSAAIPVSCSASDELEKIALREYQSSNDMFFTEIERQAKEQYDGNPENLCCPPNKCHVLGGLSTISYYYFTCFFQMSISINTYYI